jgi:hypothetical protein
MEYLEFRNKSVKIKQAIFKYNLNLEDMNNSVNKKGKDLKFEKI